MAPAMPCWVDVSLGLDLGFSTARVHAKVCGSKTGDSVYISHGFGSDYVS